MIFTGVRKQINLFAIVALILFSTGCSFPKYVTVTSEQPPNFYLGESPTVRVVDAEGGTRRLQDITILELRNQSRSIGYYTVQNALDEGIRFDTRQGRAVMTGTDVEVTDHDVFIKVNVIASLNQDGEAIITRPSGPLGLEEESVPAMVTELPVAFTVARGEEILMDERQYTGRAVWEINEEGGGYPTDYAVRLEVAVKSAISDFLLDITPRTVRRRVRLDYTGEQQETILDVARNGQVAEARELLRDYIDDNPYSASAMYNFAVMHDVLGDFERALELYDEALSLGGKDYYIETKAGCLQRLNERREMGG